MEEKKLNKEELEQVAGGAGGGKPIDRAHVTQVTEYFTDKHLYNAVGTFREGTLVYVYGFSSGSRGNCWLVRSKSGVKKVYVPDGTIHSGWDVDD